METTRNLHERLAAEYGDEYATAVRAAAAIMVATNALRYDADTGVEPESVFGHAQQLAYQAILLAPIAPPLTMIPDDVEQYASSITHGLARQHPMTWA